MGIIAFVVVLLVLVLVHEFGHFIIAKKSGIRVDEFGFGFPPKLYGKKYGETEYTFNLIPLGGFVKIFGETPDDDSISGPDSERSFVNKPAWIQAAVLSGGILFNVLLAWLLFSIIFMMGVPYADGDLPFGAELENKGLMITLLGPDSPAEEAGLTVGDKILEVTAGEDVLVPGEDIAIDEFISDFRTFVSDHHEDGVVLSYVTQSGDIGQGLIVPELQMIDGNEIYAVGIAMDFVGDLSLPPHQALIEGARQTYSFTGMMITGFYDLFSNMFKGSADYTELAGPIGIAGLVSDAAHNGLVQLLTLTAIISLNLAVLNLLPFPALDGGRLFFLLIEVIKGSPIKPAISNMVNMVGFIILLGLMVLVTWMDVSKLF